MFIKITKKNLVLIALIPFMFGCSKSKFSAVKATPPVVVNTPRPQDPVVQQPINDYEEPGYDHNCKCVPKPPVVPQPIVVTPIVIPSPKPKPIVVQPDCPPDIIIEKPDITTGIQGINLWIVMDGSKSNMSERVKQLKALIAAYDKKLARQIPVTVSVITGHSRLSPYSVVYQDQTKNFFFRSRAGEEAVIKFYPGMGKAKREAAEQALVNKILGMETDNSKGISDGGELLAFNLNAALSHDARRAWARSVGALNDDYLLQVAFMTDENDICSPGRVHNERKIGGIEVEAVAYRDHCNGMDTGAGQWNRNTNYSREEYSKALFDTLKRVSREREVMLTGYLYTNPATVPQDGENEYGNGLVQLIAATGGTAFDLAKLHSDASYKAAAEKLVDLTNVEADLFVRFEIRENGKRVPVGAIDLKETKVSYVNGGQEIKFQTDGEVLVATERCENKPIRIHYCRKK